MATEDGPLFPFGDPISELVGGRQMVQFRWRRWFLRLRQAVDNASLVIPVAPQLNQSASLPVTSMDGGSLPAGLYSISWYLSIVLAEPASTAQVTIAWVDEAGAKSKTAALVDGSTTATPQIDQKWQIYSRAASPITYSVSYAGATMAYNFRPVLQSVATS